MATALYHRARTHAEHPAKEVLPVEDGILTMAPEVPPPIHRRHAARVKYEIETTVKTIQVSPLYKYEAWTFGDTLPGPMLRLRVGDVLDITYKNNDSNGIGHNIDFHGVFGPGGGAPVLNAEAGESKHAYFKMLHPGLFVYHCAAAPVPDHVANGMYGLLLVEPEHGLPEVDKEFYVMQSEIYGEESATNKNILEYSYAQGLDERPKLVVLNGRDGALREKPLIANQGDRIRIFFGNAGPNLISSFHVIGAIFDKVYREGDLISPPARGIQTTLVPAGGAAVVEFNGVVPGNYTLVDHSIFRLDKGCVGLLKVHGQNPRTDVFQADDIPRPCEGCKLHN
jgi:copper-containing nitrite reductase